MKNFGDFSGRSQRSEYWFFQLFCLIGALVFGIADGILGTFNMESGWGLFGVIWTLVILVPGLAVTVRRLHDTGRTGWWILVVLIPLIGVIVLLIFMALDSNAEENEYGPNPKAMST